MPQGRHLARDRGVLLLRSAAVHGSTWVWGLPVAAVLAALAETVLPAGLGVALDDALTGRSGAGLVLTVGLVGVLVLADAAEDVGSGTLVAGATRWMQGRLVRHLLAADLRGPRPSDGDLTARVVANAPDAARAAPDLVRAAANLLPAVGGVVALALIDPWLCAVFVAGAPLLGVGLRAFHHSAAEATARYLRAQADLASRLSEAVAGLRSIRAAGTADQERRRILGPLPALHAAGRDMWRAQARLGVQDVLLVPLLEAAVLATGCWQLSRGRLTPGELLASVQYVSLATGLGAVLTVAPRLARSRAAADRLGELLAARPMSYGSRTLPPGPGRLELHGVTVRRDGVRVLDGVELTVPGGALVAVVGANGAGTSTLAQVAGRLLDPDEGDVLLDGVPLAELDRAALRSAVAFGFERPWLLGDTVADTLGLGTTRHGRELERAARDAQAHDFITRLPHGYGTALADAPLSGGEAQRLGLARAFLRDSRLLVLDDVAASLDTATDAAIGAVLLERLRGRTRLLVARRAATCAQADTVVWLSAGRVRARAPHAVLWCDPEYRALFSEVAR